VLEFTTRRGEEPPDHTHPIEDEMFYVLEGALTVRCGGQDFDLETGAFIFLPCGIEHGYTISNDDPVRLLVVTAALRPESAASWEGFIGALEAGQAELIAQPPDISG
jgi:quercetin dioxygenase-like cupin family protein